MGCSAGTLPPHCPRQSSLGAGVKDSGRFFLHPRGPVAPCPVDPGLRQTGHMGGSRAEGKARENLTLFLFLAFAFQMFYSLRGVRTACRWLPGVWCGHCRPPEAQSQPSRPPESSHPSGPGQDVLAGEGRSLSRIQPRAPTPASPLPATLLQLAHPREA